MKNIQMKWNGKWIEDGLLNKYLSNLDYEDIRLVDESECDCDEKYLQGIVREVYHQCNCENKRVSKELMESECEHELCKTNRSVPCDIKPECNHDHATCPGDIKTIKCAYCGESLYQKPKKIEKLEEYDLLNFENLGFKINEIIEKVNKE